MTKHRAPLLLAILPAVALLIACQTVSNQNPLDFEKAPLYGMIYDYDNGACAGVSVSVDGKYAVTSDIDGRIVLPDLSRGVHSIEASKYGYEPLAVTLDFESTTQVLYLKMISFDQLLARSQTALDENRWADANSFLARASTIRAEDPVLSYLRAILAFKQKEYPESARRLEALVASWASDPYIFLFLADLYQYHLDKPELARSALQRYLAQVDDPDVQKRLDALSASAK